MVNQLLLEKIIADIRSYVQDLRDEQEVPWTAFRSDKKVRRYIERTLHVAIEAVLDAAQHIISDEGFREPASFRDAFLVLAENGVISNELLPRLENMASVRNLLVHYYERIDNEVLFGILKKNLDDFDQYVVELSAFLRNNSNSPSREK